MKFQATGIAGAWLIALEPRNDARGSFSRVFCRRELAGVDVSFEVAQSNIARTFHAGVIRGLHYQTGASQEQKIVRCIAGAVFDALVDMRPDSPTYRKAYWVRLDAIERLALMVPAGVAHGYQALEANTDFMYLTDQYYSPGDEQGVRYSDPSLAIPWPLPPRDVTERDSCWPLLSVG